MTEPQPPSIHVYAHSAITDRQLAELLLGMEEEGVPIQVSRHDQLNPLVLAHEAAVSSRLEVGLGVALDYAVTTLRRLPEGRPYIAQYLGSADRIVGSNAARIVKRIPLRGFGEERNS